MSKVEFHPGIAQAVRELKINPVRLRQMYNLIVEAVSDLETSTKRLRGLPDQFRKLRFGDKRIVLWQSKDTVYVIRIFHRREGYSKKSLERLLTLVRELTG
ncbi:hypothetical protein HYY74_02945 [Candidatus Woesearchaeota archaeon]|nr:hypothetical protein [Candidatus Woesearchaeota archaeon]